MTRRAICEVFTYSPIDLFTLQQILVEYKSHLIDLLEIDVFAVRHFAGV